MDDLDDWTGLRWGDDLPAGFGLYGPADPLEDLFSLPSREDTPDD